MWSCGCGGVWDCVCVMCGTVLGSQCVWENGCVELCMCVDVVFGTVHGYGCVGVCMGVDVWSVCTRVLSVCL